MVYRIANTPNIRCYRDSPIDELSNEVRRDKSCRIAEGLGHEIELGELCVENDIRYDPTCDRQQGGYA